MSRKGINPAKDTSKVDRIRERVEVKTYLPNPLAVTAVQWYGGPNELYSIFDWLQDRLKTLRYKGDITNLDEAFIHEYQTLIVCSDRTSYMIPYESWILVDKDNIVTVMTDREFVKTYYETRLPCPNCYGVK